jgi:hypothetical protein
VDASSSNADISAVMAAVPQQASAREALFEASRLPAVVPASAGIISASLPDSGADRAVAIVAIPLPPALEAGGAMLLGMVMIAATAQIRRRRLFRRRNFLP